MCCGNLHHAVSISAPFSSALQSAAAARTAVRCCACSPGLLRLRPDIDDLDGSPGDRRQRNARPSRSVPTLTEGTVNLDYFGSFRLASHANPFFSRLYDRINDSYL